MSETAFERTFDSLHVGEEASLTRNISAETIDAFAELSGDYSPLHVDEEYARATPLASRVAHGMLLGSYVSALVGMQLPGASALLVKESLEFKKPVHPNTTVFVTGTITSKSEATRLIEIKILITAEGTTVAEGTVAVQVRS